MPVRRRKIPSGIFGDEDLQNKSIRKPIPKWLILAVIIVIFLIAGFAWVYHSYSQAAKRAQNYTNSVLDKQKTDAQNELQIMIDKIGKHILLPTGETPALATVMNAGTLSKDQPFYKDAQNGDKVLVYFTAKKAFLYDPNRDIIINVGPLILDNTKTTIPVPQPVVSTSTTSSAPLSIEILNGSSVAGVAATLANQLKTNPLFKVLDSKKAVNRNYQTTVLVDLTKGTKANLISSLAKQLGVKAVTSTPAGETPSKADALVIVGG